MLGRHKASAATASPWGRAGGYRWDWCQDPWGSHALNNGRVGTRGGGGAWDVQLGLAVEASLSTPLLLLRMRNSANRHTVIEAC